MWAWGARLTHAYPGHCLSCPWQERYKYLTNITRIRGLVDTYSTFKNSTFLQGGTCPLPTYLPADAGGC